MPKRRGEQAAVIAVHEGKVCLVTSTKGTRWVLPKGMIDPGHSAPQAASIEAWEEAGLTGIVDPNPIGNYRYQKDSKELTVSVYLMQVQGISSIWPEDFRRREWVYPEIAATMLEEATLCKLLLEWSINNTTANVQQN